jgi:translocation protein SEC63
MYLYVCSDSYVGLDERFVISYDVKSAGELPEYVPHPEDVELENEPTLFEQVMAANQDEADSSDDEAEPVKPINAIKEKVKKSSNSKTVPVVVDSDDGSDSADDDTDSDEE